MKLFIVGDKTVASSSFYKSLYKNIRIPKNLSNIDKLTFNKKCKNIFIKNREERGGKKMTIQLKYVKFISVEKSGKYRMIKNNIKHLI